MTRFFDSHPYLMISATVAFMLGGAVVVTLALAGVGV